MKKFLTILILSLSTMSGAAYAADQMTVVASPLTVEQATKALHDGKPVYSCQMKPDWFSDKPGQCPCCTLPLDKVTEIKDGAAVSFEGGKQPMQMNLKGMDVKKMEKM